MLLGLRRVYFRVGAAHLIFPGDRVRRYRVSSQQLRKSVFYRNRCWLKLCQRRRNRERT